MLTSIFSMLLARKLPHQILTHFKVGRHENLFIFFWKAIKIAESAQKTGSVGLAETGIFFRLKR